MVGLDDLRLLSPLSKGLVMVWFVFAVFGWFLIYGYLVDFRLWFGSGPGFGSLFGWLGWIGWVGLG